MYYFENNQFANHSMKRSDEGAKELYLGCWPSKDSQIGYF